MKDEPGIWESLPTPPGRGPIRVEVDPEIFDLVPAFLKKRHEDLEALRDALREDDAESIQGLGHKMKGMGGSYGFHYVSRAGAALEEAAREGRLEEVLAWVEGLDEYLDRVDPVEGDPEDPEEWEY